MKIVRETAKLHRLTQFGMFNCFLLKESNELTLIDTNFPGSANAILRPAASLGLPITTMALTHAHFDHFGSLDVLAQALSNAKIVIGEGEERLLRGDFSLDPGETGKPLLGFKHTLHDRGNVLIAIFYFPFFKH